MGGQISRGVSSVRGKMRKKGRGGPSFTENASNNNKSLDNGDPGGDDNDAMQARRKESLSRPLPTPPRKMRVKALYPFPGASEDDLPFKKGDLLEVDETLTTGTNEWWEATHLKSGRKGYIPSNYVVKDDETPQSQDWWFEFDRHDADKVLLLPGNKKGTFLIRQAADGKSLALSVLDQDKDELNVRHYRIKTLDNGGYYISPTRTFADLFELVNFYKMKNSTGLCCPITTACPRIRPNLQFRELEVKRDAVKLEKKLGAGCFGDVYKGKFRKVVDVAIKTLKPGTMTSDAFLEEARIMHKLSHHRLVQLMAVVSTTEPFYIITELMHNGALLEFLRSDAGKKLKFTQMIDMNAQIADGMAYLEHKNYIHRDLRAANVLVGEAFDVKVADFGLARILEGDEYNANIQAKFPIKWTAPEAANMRIFSIKSDVWSYGVLMYEIITFGRAPYPGMSGAEAMKMVEKGERMEKPTNSVFKVPDSYYDQMLKCWNQKPEERPTFESLCHFFDDYFISIEGNYRDTNEID